MKIAIIGSGIAGLTAAHLLGDEHEVVLYESGPYPGGHTNTIRLEVGGEPYALDTGFIVYNNRTYPNFTRLLDRLGVETQPSEMSFSVKCERSGLEYCGSSIGTLFAQRSNLLRPSFYRMLGQILRFNRRSLALLSEPDDHLTLGEYLNRERYGCELRDHYLIPMGAAIWSAEPRQMLDFPARYFVRFLANHGLLSITDRPQWRVIRGGSDCYVRALLKASDLQPRLNTPVATVTRRATGVTVVTRAGVWERFDEVILATHADQALAMLADATPTERAVLGAFRFQRNEAFLHTDETVLPRRRRAWASWNYHIPAAPQAAVAVTYWLNRLQTIQADQQFCVTLNDSVAVDPARVLRRITYHHPVYSAASVAAQRRHAEISGVDRIHFCGAYWGYGFHEDGVNSALAVLKHFGKNLTECKAAFTKAESATVASVR